MRGFRREHAVQPPARVGGGNAFLVSVRHEPDSEMPRYGGVAEVYVGGRAGSSVTPNPHDFEQQRGTGSDATHGTSLYSHLDSTTTAGASSGGSNGRRPSGDRASWGVLGREVAHGADGAWSLFVRQSHSGQHVVTHVTLANEVRGGCPALTTTTTTTARTDRTVAARGAEAAR